MMGRDKPPQRSLFYTGINLDKRVRGDHVLRKVSRLVDFDFVYGEVEKRYGYNGNVSVAPPLIVKLMLLLVLYNVRSERELMATLPERLDWLWFLGLDLDSEVPDHSVLSKARKRWGVELFQSFFERIVWQCVEVGFAARTLLCLRQAVDPQQVGGRRHRSPALPFAALGQHSMGPPAHRASDTLRELGIDSFAEIARIPRLLLTLPTRFRIPHRERRKFV